MWQFKHYLHKFCLSTIILIGLITGSCGISTPPTASKPSTQPTTDQSPTAKTQSIKSMRVDIGGYKLYVQGMGQGTPTVLFEAQHAF